MNEKVDLKQLRDPVGFVNGIDRFIQDTRADVQTLQHFADTYAQSVSADPAHKKVAAGIKISLPNLTRALDMLEKGLGQLNTKDAAAGKKNPDDSRLPGVQGQPPAKKSGILSKLFGGGK